MKIMGSRLAAAMACVGASGVLVAGLAVTAAHATPSTASSTILAQSTVMPLSVHGHGKTASGSPWNMLLKTHGTSDGYVVDNKFAPGQTTGWHGHPGPSLIFVVSGTVTNYDSNTPGCAGQSYSAGSSFTDDGGTDVHMLRNESSLPAETIAVQFIPNGQPRRIDVATQPANCHV